jgi:hypothetical protein
MSITTAENPRTVGPSLGPIGLTPSAPTRRMGYVVMRGAMHAGDTVRMHLPADARVIEIIRDHRNFNTRIYFSTPALRELANGEAPPRYTYREALGGAFWWEEVPSTS